MRDLTARAIVGCPVETAMTVIGGCWKLTLIQALIDSNVPLRYSELRDKAGEISDRTLTRSLRELESDGIVVRTAYAEVPPRVEYELTDIGRSLAPIISAIQTWGDEWLHSYSKLSSPLI
ncbi:MarR family transcriptional regulator [Corynebacterium suranareeae]|uniref:MarR family transcriptional regulator n=2 Tax=Corynebacterium suranareeae TaxID=2506452 RepID=A0A161JNS6_9CORY|nr:MarR family transcriptional regulator [Corynebacterium suranareeae]